MWLQILFTISLFGLSNCCSCAPPNITNTYCLADAVAHVVVHNATVNLSVGNEYGVEYIKIYRKTEKFDNVSEKSVVNTPPTGGACGVPIDPKSADQREWLLFIFVQKDKSFIFLCSNNQVWDDDIKRQLQNGLVKINCAHVGKVTESQSLPERNAKEISKNKSKPKSRTS